MEQFNDLFNIGRLISGYLRDNLTEKEQHELQDWLNAKPEHRMQFERLTAEAKIKGDHDIYAQTDKASAWARIVKETGYRIPKKSSQIKFRIATIAASILIFFAVGSYFLVHQKPILPVVAIKPGTFKNDARPGNKAILTLANGKHLAIEGMPAGYISNTSIQKSKNGTLIYNQSSSTPDVYNTLTVPNGGGKHELKLADGTLAILDAGSSIQFPVAFNGRERRVSITGQVYFEVVHHVKKPFFVSVMGQTIEDIGTHFNINAFDGVITTTLLEGSVKVGHTILKPGQQAVQTASGQLSMANEVDVEAVVAWKNGLFKFDHTDLNNVMKQLTRWYDVDVIYEGPDKPYHFGGYLSRDGKLTSVLKILQLNGVKFSLDGRKLIVYR